MQFGGAGIGKEGKLRKEIKKEKGRIGEKRGKIDTIYGRKKGKKGVTEDEKPCIARGEKYHFRDGGGGGRGVPFSNQNVDRLLFNTDIEREKMQKWLPVSKGKIPEVVQYTSTF
jgi:hypothetical protein